MVVHLRQRICYLLSILRIHNPDCTHCNARQTCWDDTVRRLNELDASGQSTFNSGDQRENAGSRFRIRELKSRSASALIALHFAPGPRKGLEIRPSG